MDHNHVFIAGRLAAPPEVRQFDSGSRLARYLVTVRSEEPRKRVDVLGVTLWDPPDQVLTDISQPGLRVHVMGSIQRRFWDGPRERRSRLEIVAELVSFRPEPNADS